MRFFGCEPSSLAVIPTQVSATGYPVRAMLNVIFFLLSDFPSSEFSVPAFRNALFHLRLNKKRPMTMEDTMFRNVGTENSDPGESPPPKKTLQSKYGASLKSSVSI